MNEWGRQQLAAIVLVVVHGRVRRA